MSVYARKDARFGCEIKCLILECTARLEGGSIAAERRDFGDVGLTLEEELIDRRDECVMEAHAKALSRANLHEQEPMFSPPKAPSRSRSLLDVRNPAQNPPEKCGDLSSGSNRSELDSGRTTRRSREGSDGEQRRLQQEFLNRRAAWYKSCKVKESTSSQSNKPTRRVSCTAPTCSTTAHGVGHLASQERATPCAHMSLMYGFSHTRVLRVLNFAVAFLVCALLYYGDSGIW